MSLKRPATTRPTRGSLGSTNAEPQNAQKDASAAKRSAHVEQIRKESLVYGRQAARSAEKPKRPERDLQTEHGPGRRHEHSSAEVLSEGAEMTIAPNEPGGAEHRKTDDGRGERREGLEPKCVDDMPR